MAWKQTAALAVLASGVALGASTVNAKDYILTGIKPDKLVLIDAKARKVERVYTIPDGGPGLLTITPSPDGKIAYAIVNRWESVSGIDLETGQQVFRADLSSTEERVKSMAGMDISPDGKELAVYEVPVRIGKDEYQVLPTRISIYDTSSGLAGKRIRQFEAPRQITVLAYSTDGTTLFGMGRSLFAIDAQTGAIKAEHQTQGWDRPNFYPPDILSFWAQYEQAKVFSTPYFTARSDMDLANPEAWWTGLLTVDLVTGEFKLRDMTNLDVFYFSTVVNPVRRNEVYGVYLTLAKFDLDKGERVASVDLDHSYYDVNISSDGSEIYVGGTLSDIAVYNSQTLEKIGSIELPGGASMAVSSIRVIDR